jgi:hypothetical protein
MNGYLGSLMRMSGINFGPGPSAGHLEAAGSPQPIHREETKFVEPPAKTLASGSNRSTNAENTGIPEKAPIQETQTAENPGDQPLTPAAPNHADTAGTTITNAVTHETPGKKRKEDEAANENQHNQRVPIEENIVIERQSSRDEKTVDKNSDGVGAREDNAITQAAVEKKNNGNNERDISSNSLKVGEQNIEYEIEFEEIKPQEPQHLQPSQPALEQPTNQVQTPVPGENAHVIKHGKGKNETETGKETDSSSSIALADIQQWVSAVEPESLPAVNKSQTRSTSPREQVSRQQQEVQEFTLSIGSINLTVEEPQSIIQQEPPSPPVSAGRPGVGESSASRLGRHSIRVR